MDVRAILQTSGWFEGRQINTEEMEQRYRDFGYEVFPAVQHFLQEFGKLEIIIAALETEDDWEERHHTEPEEVLCDYYRHGQFEVEEGYAGERLVPVGEVCNGNLLLFVSESGKLYHSTGKLGDEPWEAWEALIKKSGFKDWSDLQRERNGA